MKLKININFLEKYLANLVNDIQDKRITKELNEYERIIKKLNEYDLMADVDDQRSHHFYSWFKYRVKSNKLKLKNDGAFRRTTYNLGKKTQILILINCVIGF